MTEQTLKEMTDRTNKALLYLDSPTEKQVDDTVDGFAEAEGFRFECGNKSQRAYRRGDYEWLAFDWRQDGTGCGTWSYSKEESCAYCDGIVTGDDCGLVPDVDDKEAWDRQRQYHAEDCEWLRTRAHWLERV